MELANQRGSSLVEATVTVAVVAILAGATLGAIIAVTRATGGNAVHDALQTAAQREASVAADVLKYQDASIAPASVATTLPMPTGSPLAAQLAISTSVKGGTLDVTVQATASKSGEQAIVETRLRAQAPIPGAQVQVSGLAPAPTGAP